MVSSVELDEMIECDMQFAIKKSRQKNACQLQAMLYQQSMQGSEFCDVSLNIGNTIYMAHSRVLTFSRCLTVDWRRVYQILWRWIVELHMRWRRKLSSSTNGDPSESVADILDVLEVTDYLQLEEMIDICLWQWQVTNAILKNCEKTLLLVSQHNLPMYDTELHFVNGQLPEL